MKRSDAIIAIHWKAGEITVTARRLKRNSQTMAAEIMTFFQKVAQFEIISASPKQPQSATGSAMAIQSVRGSMTAIMAAAHIGVERR